jgi:hypothetical protein
LKKTAAFEINNAAAERPKIGREADMRDRRPKRLLSQSAPLKGDIPDSPRERAMATSQ